MPSPAQLQQALIEAYNRRDWNATIAHGEALLAHLPEHPGAHYLTGVARLERGDLARALAHLHTACERVPDRPDLLANYARGLAEAQLTTEALATVERALALQPDDPGVLVMLALTLTRLQQHEHAAPLLARAAEHRPDDPYLRHHLAVARMFQGDLATARHEIEACLRLDPSQWAAYDTRAQIRRARDDDHAVEAMQALLLRHEDDPEAVEHLCMALSRELDALDRPREAFVHLQRAKALGKARQPYDADAEARLFEQLMAQAPAPVAEGCGDPAPIFVLGLPRSGTTLVERILAAHPQVQGLGELHQFGTALKRATGVKTRAPLDAATIGAARTLDWDALGRAYLHAVAPLRHDAPRFVDKLPHNFLFTGYIANALPRAAIVCLRRHPMDVCLGNFRQRFGERSPLHAYAHDLLDIGRYYLQFDRLMRFWRERLPGRVLELSYEALVADPAAATRMLLEHCGLPWDDACLHAERATGAVGTASAAQVREPIHRRAVAQWKRYAAELQPLRELLEAGGIRIED